MLKFWLKWAKKQYGNIVSPDKLFKSKEWIDSVYKCYDLEGYLIQNKPMIEKNMLKQSKLILNILENRLNVHIEHCLSESPSKKFTGVYLW